MESSDIGQAERRKVMALKALMLRKKIDDNFDKKLIHTIRGKGYILREANLCLNCQRKIFDVKNEEILC